MSKEKKIALIELTTYHEECLFSQLEFLTKATYDVTLITHPKNALNIPYYGLPENKIKFYNPRGSVFLPMRIINWFKLYRFITKNGFQKVVFNTASSNKEVIALTRFLPKTIACLGIIHNLKKLNSSASQKVISKRIKEYFVLNDYLKSATELENRSIKLHSFYPIFFPSYKSFNTRKKDKDIWICIPGELNYHRRDYSVVLSALTTNKPLKNIKIIILGKLDVTKEHAQLFLKELTIRGLEEVLITFERFIPNEEFHAYLRESDYIMAPVSLVEKKYIQHKITGAYNLAFAYKKPLICPEELSVIPDLKANAHFYSDANSLAALLRKISNKELNTEPIYKDSKWTFKEQQNNYLKLLEK